VRASSLQRFLPPFRHAGVRRRRRWPGLTPPVRERTIDLRRTLVGGEGRFDAGRWAELTGDPRRSSMLLGDSPHVQLLEQYRAAGEALFRPGVLQETPYFKNATHAIRFCGSYFGHRTAEGITAQARSFVLLYDRAARDDPTGVPFSHRGRHSAAASLPLVRATLTPGVMQIVDGQHRLAVAWALGHREAAAATTWRRKASPLQSLVLRCAQTHGRRELYQPIDSIEFDGSWGLVRRCRDRLTMMLDFLSTLGRPLPTLSVLDLACAYGWFVREFSIRGADALGVDMDATPLKIGRIAYGLRGEQMVREDLGAFPSRASGRRWDVVLLLSVLHHFVLTRRRCGPEDLLRRIDRITGSCLFLDTGQSHERWWRGRLSAWDDTFVIDFVRRHTSFNHIVPLGVDTDNTGPYRDNYRRTLFACLRA
jgi:SAM-dependent methyltransferase